MVELHLTPLVGERARYHGETWTFTGDITIKQNGDLLEATATAAERSDATRGTLRFQLRTTPASINPGNPDIIGVELAREGGVTILELRRRRQRDRYAFSSVSYG